MYVGIPTKESAMKKYFESLRACALFANIAQDELEGMLACLNAELLHIGRGKPVFLEGDPAEFVGVVLEGAVQVVRDDYYGKRSVLTLVEPTQMFAEAFACADVQTMPVSVFAVKESVIMRLDCRRILTVCSNACRFHTQLVRNLLRIVSEHNLRLSRKIEFMSQRTTREKLMAYLLAQAKQAGSSEFIIPYDRQALADFLGVERSAMSAELSKLRRDGRIEFRGSWFRLTSGPEES